MTSESLGQQLTTNYDDLFHVYLLTIILLYATTH
jgi:hypothetical protein